VSRVARGIVVSVAAGKGGTGKTLVATALAVSLAEGDTPDVVLIDCDVEEPNAHILLEPRIEREEPVCIPVPQVDQSACTNCGLCAEKCESHAIAAIGEVVVAFPHLCSGCGLCSLICPAQAISEVPLQVGVVRSGPTREGIEFVEGRTNVGQLRAGPVIRAAKRHIRPDVVTIIDAPPGTACPMQGSIESSDYCILVTEPTPFGLCDLKSAIEVCRQFGVPCGIVVNRDGIGDRGLDDYCDREALPILMRIPQRREIAEAYSRGENLVSAFPEWVEPLREMFEVVAKQTGVSGVAAR
jgi:MinD superfamily P-loop ATPase